jgi:hypothetical protein
VAGKLSEITPGNIPVEDWKVVQKVARAYEVDPFLIVAIGFAETQWFKKGLGLQGLGLGVGAYDSGATFRYAGVKKQVERGCQILRRNRVRFVYDIALGKLHSTGRWEWADGKPVRYVGPPGSVKWASADTEDRGFPWSRNVVSIYLRILAEFQRQHSPA